MVVGRHQCRRKVSVSSQERIGVEPVKDTQEADLDHLTLNCRETCVLLLPW